MNHLEVTEDNEEQVTLTWEVGMDSPSAGDDDRLRVIEAVESPLFFSFCRGRSGGSKKGCGV